MKINVNPKILTWARGEMGMSSQFVATKLKINVMDLNRWEKDGIAVGFGALEKIARLYKRQMAVFFLNDVPQKTKKPKDYRNLGSDNETFSPETMLAIRRTERYLDLVRGLNNSAYWKKNYEWHNLFDKGNISEEAAINILNELFEYGGVGKLPKNSDAAFRYWREKIESCLNIFVFQFPMDESELDGFSYINNDYPYAIVVNQRNSATRKIFTIFHEIAHLIKHRPGICKTDYHEDNKEMEFECNSFAAKFLVPSKFIETTTDVDRIIFLARSLHVSSEVYLRRLYEEEMINKSDFFDLLLIVRERSKSFRKLKRKKTGAPSMIIQSKSTRGTKFFNIVSGAATNNTISYSRAADMLGLKATSIRV